MADGFPIYCTKCRQQLTDPGAIILSPPIELEGRGTYYRKSHVCRLCFEQGLIGWMAFNGD